MARTAILLVTLAALGWARAEAGDLTPKPGSQERKDILDAVRDPLEDVLQREIIFRVTHLKVKDGWAFLRATPRTKDDKPIDYKGTRFENEASWMDESLVAVLRYKRKRWYVVTKAVFTTDVWWAGIHEELKAPPEIFDYPIPKGDS